MFDHNIFQENLVGVDYCEKMVSETNPGVLAKAENTAGAARRRARLPHHRRHHAGAQPVHRRVLPRGAAGQPVDAGDVLPDGGSARAPVHAVPGRRRHRRDHPADDRLHDPADALRRVHEEGRADARRPVRLLLRGAARLRAGRPAPHPARLLGLLPGSRGLQLRLQGHGAAGATRCSSPPAWWSTASCVTTRLVDINLGIRILLGSSYYDDWTDQEMFVKTDPLGNPVDRRHPWNQHTNPRPQKRDLDDKYSWVMSPRWFDGKDHLALDTGGGPLARLWSTALAGLVDIGYVKATGNSVQINLPKTALKGPVELRVEDPAVGATRSSATAPAPTSRPTPRRARCTSPRRRWSRSAPAAPRPGRSSRCPTRASAAASPRRSAACCRHHMVIRDGKIANYHPYPPTPWNANPRDSYGTPGPYEDAVQGQPIFEENDREHFKGIDIMRTVRSFDPCLPCGVHMYLGEGKTLERLHSPDPVGDRGVSVWPRRHCQARTKPGRRAVAHGGRADRDAARRRASAGGAVARERAEELVREVADLYGAGAGADAGDRRRSAAGPGPARTGSPPTTWSPACCWCTACTRTTSSDGCPTRWTACGPTSARTAATWTLLGRDRRRTWSGCSFRAAARAARRRRSTLELAVEDAIRAARSGDLLDRGRVPRTRTRRSGVIPADVAADPAAHRARPGSRARHGVAAGPGARRAGGR